MKRLLLSAPPLGCPAFSSTKRLLFPSPALTEQPQANPVLDVSGACWALLLQQGQGQLSPAEGAVPAVP